MIINLIPIIQPDIAWEGYLKYSHNILGRSPTEELDKRSMKFNCSFSNFLASLKEIEKPGSEPLGAAGLLLQFMSFAFILVATKQTTMDIMRHSRLAFITTNSKHSDYSYSIVSGSLLDWRTAVMNCCVEEVTIDVRMFGSKIIDYFASINLNEFLFAVIKIKMGDGTIRVKRE